MISLKDAATFFKLTVTPIRKQLADLGLSHAIDEKGNAYITTENFRKLRIERKMPPTRKIVTVGVEKGGTGKTVTTLHLATTAARYGWKTLVCDLDPECCISLLLAKQDFDWKSYLSVYEVFSNSELSLDSAVYESRFDGLDFVPAKGVMRRLERELGDINPRTLLKKKLHSLQEQYDLIIFDLPPSFNRLCVSAYLTADSILCPVNPDIFALQTLGLTLEDIDEACEEWEVPKPQIHVLKNRFKAPGARSLASTDIGCELDRDFADLLLPIQVKSTDSVTNCLNGGHSLYDYPKRDPGIESLKLSFFEITWSILGV
jgi:chromosome partitioning protein